MYNRKLLCGCCGVYFTTWEGYEDQGQDKGFGICKECQNWQEKQERHQVEELVQKLHKALNPENKKKLENMSYEDKKLLVYRAIEDKIITFSIKK